MTDKLHAAVPSQNDVRLNTNALGDAPAKPAMEGWRQFDPSRVTRDYDFLLNEVLHVEAFKGKVDGYDDLDANFATLSRFEPMAAAMHAVSQQGDRDPVKMRVVADEPGKRHIETVLPESISGPGGLHQQFSEGGWTNVTTAKENGGQGLPHAFTGAVSEMGFAANPGYAVLEFLSKGVQAALEMKGSQELKDTWLPRLNDGSFTGAMVMTEPKYGSELANVETTVQLDESGKAGRVYGYKRFLSSADHDATVGPEGERQIVHMVLARTADKDGNLLLRDKSGQLFPMNAENAGRAGRPALTLMLVPRVLVDKAGDYIDEQGQPSDKPHANNVRAVKLNDKMGLEVQSNTDAAYDGAHAQVVGEVGEGMKNMFVIMNEARLGVGLQAIGTAEIALQNVERYAFDERKQFGELIGEFPDVMKNVLQMRAAIDAGRSIAADVGMAVDKSLHAKPGAFSEHEMAENKRYVDVMTPLVKWGLTEKGDAAVDAAQQMMGGAGYMREWGMAQLRADVRISRIYEGSNPVLGISEISTQLNNMDVFFDRMGSELDKVKGNRQIRDVTAGVERATDTFREAVAWMKATGLQARQGGKDSLAAKDFQAAAMPFMEMMYNVAAATALAKNADVASRKLASGQKMDAAEEGFYEAKISTARRFVQAELGKKNEMHLEEMHNGASLLEIPDMGLVAPRQTAVEAASRAAKLAAVKGSDVADSLRDRMRARQEARSR